MTRVRAGDCVRYLSPRLLSPLTGVVARRHSRRTLVLCDESWIAAADVLAVVHREQQMPSLDKLSADALYGRGACFPAKSNRRVVL